MSRFANPRAYEISIEKLHGRLEKVVSDVARGATVTVTRNGTAVVQIAPAVEANPDLDFSALRAGMPQIGDEAQRLLKELRGRP